MNIKRIALFFIFALAILFAGCDQGQNKNDNQNTNQTNQTGDFSQNIPPLVLEEGQDIDTESGDTPGWDAVADENESIGQEQALSKDQWKGDPAHVLFEFFFRSHVSGEALNQSHRVTGLQADLTGIIVVYQDGSVGGTGNIIYTGDQGCEIVEPSSQSLLSCEFNYAMDGTFNITGEVIEYEDFGQTSGTWPSGKYWLKLIFLEDQMPLENVNIINNISGNTQSVDNKDLHLALYSGLFYQPQIMYPLKYNELSKNFANSYATSSVSFEFVDNIGQAEFEVLRKVMGLKVQ